MLVCPIIIQSYKISFVIGYYLPYEGEERVLYLVYCVYLRNKDQIGSANC